MNSELEKKTPVEPTKQDEQKASATETEQNNPPGPLGPGQDPPPQ